MRQLFNGDSNAGPVMQMGGFSENGGAPDPHHHAGAIMHIVDPETGGHTTVTVAEYASQTHINPSTGEEEPNYDPHRRAWSGPWVTQTGVRPRHG